MLTEAASSLNKAASKLKKRHQIDSIYSTSQVSEYTTSTIALNALRTNSYTVSSSNHSGGNGESDGSFVRTPGSVKHLRPPRCEMCDLRDPERVLLHGLGSRDSPRRRETAGARAVLDS
jgi:hypothetical protein